MSDGFKPLKIDLSGISFNHLPRINPTNNDLEKAAKEIWRNKQEEKEEVIAYREEKLELLRDIKTSLEGLDDVVYLLSRSVSQQEETLELLTEVFSIGTSPDEETAQSRYQKVKDKIHEVVDDAEAVKTLVGLAKYIYIKAIELL